MAEKDTESNSKLYDLFKRTEKRHLEEKVRIIEALVSKFGPEVIEIVEKIRSERTRQSWSGIAQQIGKNSIDDLIGALWESGFNLFDYSVQRDGNRVQMKVTRCFFHDLAKEIGVTEMAFHLFCVDDPHIVNGFNPAMGFHRTKTLMQGHDCCDHCYRL